MFGRRRRGYRNIPVPTARGLYKHRYYRSGSRGAPHKWRFGRGNLEGWFDNSGHHLVWIAAGGDRVFPKEALNMGEESGSDLRLRQSVFKGLNAFGEVLDDFDMFRLFCLERFYKSNNPFVFRLQSLELGVAGSVPIYIRHHSGIPQAEDGNVNSPVKWVI